MDYVWILQDITVEGHVLAFTAQHLAMHAAERIVGNGAYSGPIGSDRMIVYGHGDGSTRVMIRCFTRSDAFRIFPDITLPPIESA